MANSFWQARMAENHLSNLLKKNLEPMIAAFGFPLIQKDQGGGTPMLSIDREEKQTPEPQMNSEDIYRRKFLDLERHTQQIERDAYSLGFAQGEKDGFDYGQKSVQVVKSQLERIAQNLEALPAKIFEDYRDWLIQTSIRIARQIVNREIQTCPEIVADTVRALIGEAQEHGTLSIYLNPNDLEIVEKRAELTLGANGKHFVLKADRDLERGGCRIESAVQVLDASIATLFENLEKKLLDGATSQDATGKTGGEQLEAPNDIG
jgi:flagellar assembly protein FliH